MGQNLYVLSLYRNRDLLDRIFDCLLASMAAVHVQDIHASFLFVCKKKVKSSMARSLPVENLLPQNVGSIINYLQ